MKKYLWVVFGLLGCAIMASDIILDKVDNKFDLSTYVLVWWPTLGTILGIFLWKPRQKTVWYLWLAGAVSLLIANTLRYFDIPAHVTTPGIRDVFYLASYLYAAFALIIVVQKRDDRRDPIAGLAAIIITLGLTALVYAQVLIDLMKNDDELFVLQEGAYIFLQMCFIATVIRLFLSSGRHTGTFWIVMALGWTYLIGAFTDSEMQTIFASGGEPDFGSPEFIALRYVPTFLSYILYGLAPMHPTMWRFGRYKDPKPFVWRWRREVALVGFMLMPLLVTLYSGPAGPLRVLGWVNVLLMIGRYWVLGYMVHRSTRLALELIQKEVNGGADSRAANRAR